MSNLKLLSIELENFGPFLGKHLIEFPENGMVLLKGLVHETKDGSGAGKSYILNAIPFIFGCCPFPSTELQSWYTDDPPAVTCRLKTDKGVLTIGRKKGLTITGGSYPEPVKGKAAELELDKIFGMGSDARAVVTYRGQRQPGLFISLSDSEKKSFLSKLLDLDKYDILADKTKDEISKLETEKGTLDVKRSTVLDSLQAAVANCERSVEVQKATPQVDLKDLEENQNKIKEIKDQCAANQKTAIQIKDKYNPDLEIIQNESKSSIKAILSQPEPLDVSNLRSSKEFQQKDYQSAKDVYSGKRLEVEKAKAAVNAKISRLSIDISKKTKLEKELALAKHEEECLNSNECPTCNQKWVGSTAQQKLKACKELQEVCLKELSRISELEKQSEELKVELSQLVVPTMDPDLGILEKSIKETDLKILETLKRFEATKQEQIKRAELDETTAKQVVSTKINNELAGLADSQRKLKAELEVLVLKDKEYNQINDLHRQKSEQVQLNKGNVDHYQANLVPVDRQLEEIVKTLNLKKDVEALVGRKGFLGVIFEDVLNEISMVANDILGKVANVSHLTIEFKTEKENKKGNLTTKITPVIYSRGREVSFSAGISGGMQVAVELAIDLAFGDVVARRRGSYPGWLILDETFHGLGGVAKESCLEILNNYSQDKLILVVDHDTAFQGLFHNIIEVEQQDGLSRIV